MPEWSRQYFPQLFTNQVTATQALYAYIDESNNQEKQYKIAKAKIHYYALFYQMPPQWMDAAYDDLAAQIISDAPPTRQDVSDSLACIAVATQLSRIQNARSSVMAEINRFVQLMDGAVERQFIKLGAKGQEDFRHCLLVCWAHQTGLGQKNDILRHLEELVAVSTEKTMKAQLHLDLHDCNLSLGNTEQAVSHFTQAKSIVVSMTTKELLESAWYCKNNTYSTKGFEVYLDPQIVLLSLWLNGYFLKQKGDYTFDNDPVAEVEIAMPNGFLSMIFSVLADKGLIRLPNSTQSTLLPKKEQTYFGFMIKPDQGDWVWEPELLSKEISKHLEDARQAGQPGFLDKIYALGSKLSIQE